MSAVAGCLAAVALIFACTDELGDRAVVVRVIDGDTVEIDSGARVRYIGIDTPESTIAQECFGSEASRRNEQLVQGRVVRLETDVSETDRFGRLLRYVWLDGQLVNEVLVREGYAVSSTYPPDVRYQDRFLAAEREARLADAGLWGACGSAGQALDPTPVVRRNCDAVRGTQYLSDEERAWFLSNCITPLPPPPVAPVSDCHPSYLGACLVVGIGDYDCARGRGNGPNYIRGPIQVVGFDEFELDGDGDGIGCE